jgi:hypothetical protein
MFSPSFKIFLSVFPSFLFRATIYHRFVCAILWYTIQQFCISNGPLHYFSSTLSSISRRLFVSEYQNCWEYEQCGREPFGRNVKEQGVCPAAIETKLNGVHGGTNAGRACWVVAGTLCQGEVQGVFARKYMTCQECDFYKKVQQENYTDFEVSVSLLQRLRKSH